MANVFKSLDHLEKILNSAIQREKEARSALIQWAWQVHGEGGDVPDYVWRIVLPDGCEMPPKSKSKSA